MYTESVGTNNVPAFLSKLWRLVDSQNSDLISWSPNGKSFIIRNQAKFAKQLLPLYFKHNNMASFIRQLNMYGFRKITHIENSGLKVENDEIEFYHSCFVKGQESMLEHIKRKNSLSVAHPKSISALKDKTNNKEEVHLILTDVKGIKNKQDNMNSMLVSLQNENEALWKEIASLRHKHQKQQQIVERLIHFLMSLVQSGNLNNIGLKRKAPLMIDDKNGNKRVDLASMASNLLNSGPIIQEITHGLLDGDDEEFDSNLDSPIVNTALSDTSEPAPQLDDTINDGSPIFAHTPTSSNRSQQQSIEIGELKDSGGQVGAANLFDPLQESINAINDDDDQIIDLNEVGAIEVASPSAIQSTSPVSSTVHNLDIENNYPSTQSTITTTNLPTNTSDAVDSPNQLKLVLPSNTPPPSHNYHSNNLVPSTSSVLNTPSIITENFDNHLEGIDTELKTLQDQLLGNFNIDSNVLMGLFSQDDLQKSLQTMNAAPASSMITNSPMSTPKSIDIQQQTIIEPSNLNSNFDLSDIVNSNEDDYLLNSEEQIMKQQNLINPSYESMDMTPIFDSDDILNTDMDTKFI